LRRQQVVLVAEFFLVQAGRPGPGMVRWMVKAVALAVAAEVEVSAGMLTLLVREVRQVQQGALAGQEPEEVGGEHLAEVVRRVLEATAA
jgi:hypothetical protein